MATITRVGPTFCRNYLRKPIESSCQSQLDSIRKCLWLYSKKCVRHGGSFSPSEAIYRDDYYCRSWMTQSIRTTSPVTIYNAALEELDDLDELDYDKPSPYVWDFEEEDVEDVTIEEVDMSYENDRRNDNQTDTEQYNAESRIDHNVPYFIERKNLLQFVKDVLNKSSEKQAEDSSKISDLHSRSTRQTLKAISTRWPHILGLSVDQVKNRIEHLEENGLPLREALLASIHVSSALSLEDPGFTSIVKLLNEMQCNLEKHFLHNQWIFSLSPKDCEIHINNMKKCGLSNRSIGRLIDANPLILSMGLDHTTIDWISQLKKVSKNKNSNRIEGMIFTSLKEPAVFMPLNVQNVCGVFNFFKQFAVDAAITLKKCPKFLYANEVKLISTVKVLMSVPLACGESYIRKLITYHPDEFLELTKDNVDKYLEVISEISKAPNTYSSLLDSFPLYITQASLIKERFELLKKFKFSNDLLRKIIYQCITTDCADFEKKLCLLIEDAHFQPEEIARYWHVMCNKDFLFLKARLDFLKLSRPDSYADTSFSDVFYTKNVKFAVSVCQSSNSKFSKYMNSLEDEDYFPED